MSKFLFISVKPEFASKIMGGTKTIELRKSKPKAKPGDFIIIYSTLPIKSVIGFGRIKRVIDNNPEYIWDNYSDLLGIDNTRFNEYYKGMNKAVGIEIHSICELSHPINLSEIKKFSPKFSPPQTYRYLSNFKALKIYLSINNC